MCSIQTIFIIITKRQYDHHHTHKIKVAKGKKKSYDKDNDHDYRDKDPTLFWFLLSKQSNPSTTYLLQIWAKNTKYNFPDFFRWIFMIRWQMTNPGFFHTDWKGSAWIKMNKIFLCNNFSKYFCALHIACSWQRCASTLCYISLLHILKGTFTKQACCFRFCISWWSRRTSFWLIKSFGTKIWESNHRDYQIDFVQSLQIFTIFKLQTILFRVINNDVVDMESHIQYQAYFQHATFLHIWGYLFSTSLLSLC